MNSNGFTLIELLVVIAIIGLLAIAAVPQVRDAICDSRISRAKKDLNTAQTAVHQAMSKDRKSWSEIHSNCDSITSDCNSLSEYLPERLWQNSSGASDGSDTRLRLRDAAGERGILTDLPAGCEFEDDVGDTCEGGGGTRIQLNITTGKMECFG